MKKITVIQSSLREGSNTAIVCRAFAERCDALGIHVHYVDLKNVKMDFCDGRSLEQYSKQVQDVAGLMGDSDAVIFGMPVYHYSMSGVLKNFVDIAGDNLTGKHVGLIMTSIYENAYMSRSHFLDCLYLKYETQNLSPTPHALTEDFENGKIVNEKVLAKLDELAQKIISL